MNNFRWMLHRLGGKLWLRALAFCLAGIVTALAGLYFKRFIPSHLTHTIGADAVGTILNIIASSMLTVTTFSLSTMVSAFAAASTGATPRAAKLLLEDRVAQNALSTFVGSFLFSLVGIIALQMGVYGDSGRVVLFVATLVVILFVVGMLLRWIDRLSRLGRVGQTIDMVEAATASAMRERLAHPYLGGVALTVMPSALTHHPVMDDRVGYVAYIDMNRLAAVAERAGATIVAAGLPGTFNDTVRPIAWTDRPVEATIADDLREAFKIEGERSYDQDPRFGMIVLTEIASRALSPAINDPGTAIDVIGTQLRLFKLWLHRYEGPDPPVIFPRVQVPVLKLADFCEDVFPPIARDGAGLAEIGIRLQKSLATLAALQDGDCRALARRHAETCFRRAETALTDDTDRERMRQAAEWLQKTD